MEENSSILSKIMWSIISFMCPVVGIILFILWHNKKRKLSVFILIFSILGILFGYIGYKFFTYSLIQSGMQ